MHSSRTYDTLWGGICIMWEKGLVCICFTFQIFMSSVEGDNLSKYKGIPDHLTLDLTSYWRQDCLDRLST